MTTTVPPSGLPLKVRVRARPAAATGPSCARDGRLRGTHRPRGELVADASATSGVRTDRPVRVAGRAWRRRSSGRRAASVSGDDDQVHQRIEAVLQQPVLSDDLLDQLEVLDRRRQLPRDLVGELQVPGRRSARAGAAPSRTSVPRARRQPRSGATIAPVVEALGRRAVDGQAQRRRGRRDRRPEPARRSCRAAPPERAANQSSRARRSCSQMATRGRAHQVSGLVGHAGQRRRRRWPGPPRAGRTPAAGFEPLLKAARGRQHGGRRHIGEDSPESGGGRTPHSKMMGPKGKPTADCVTRAGV